MPHWTRELFEKHPELFLDTFEERRAWASGEVRILLRYLNEQGFQPKRVLDFNCGVGRHSIELAKRGIEVLGTDLSPNYIEIAQRRAREEELKAKAGFRVADMREIASKLSQQEEPFDGIVNLWTSFGFYDDETNAGIIRQCLGLVRPGGFFALDIVNRDWLVSNFSARGFARHKDRIVLEERQLDIKDSRMYNTWTYLRQKDDKTFILEKDVRIDHRVWSLHELIELFQRAGWRFKAAYPGFSPGATPSPGAGAIQERDLLRSQMLLVICYRAETER